MKKGLLHILAANIIYLVVNILNSFLLPKFLSVDTYAIIKTYTLYIGYAGFLSLGYADGMYLKYGGKDIKNINKKDLSDNYRSYAILEIIASLVCLILACVLKDFVFISFAFGSFCINIVGYYKNLYQAVGEYKLYGRALNYQTILLFAMNMILLFAFKLDDSKIYIIIQVITALIVMIYLTIVLNKKTNILSKGEFSFHHIKENVASGFTLMLGNFSSSIFTSLDRWFIKILMSNMQFAYYSFAVSLENIVNVFVTPITISLYNVFCRNRSTKYVLKIKRLTLLWGFLIIAAAYPVKFIIDNYLSQYNAAISIIYPLFATQAFYAVIKGIHVNLYKADHKQKKYFKVMLVMMVLAIVFNGVLYLLFDTVDSFAIATLIVSIVWFMYCEYETKQLRFRPREYMAIVLLLIIFFITSGINNSVIGLLTYIGSYILIVFFLMNDTFKYLLNTAITWVKKGGL